MFYHAKSFLVLRQVLGIMGALDPHAHKQNQQLSGSHGEVTRATSDSGQHIQPMDEFPMDLWPSFATSEDYYSTVLFIRDEYSLTFLLLFFH